MFKNGDKVMAVINLQERRFFLGRVTRVGDDAVGTLGRAIRLSEAGTSIIRLDEKRKRFVKTDDLWIVSGEEIQGAIDRLLNQTGEVSPDTLNVLQAFLEQFSPTAPSPVASSANPATEAVIRNGKPRRPSRETGYQRRPVSLRR